MTLLYMTILAAALMAAAVYAQLELPGYVAGEGKLLIARAVLIGVGAGFALVSAAPYAEDPAMALLAGLIGFGAVHFPAAFILMVKRQRGTGPS